MKFEGGNLFSVMWNGELINVFVYFCTLYTYYIVYFLFNDTVSTSKTLNNFLRMRNVSLGFGIKRCDFSM